MTTKKLIALGLLVAGSIAGCDRGAKPPPPPPATPPAQDTGSETVIKAPTGDLEAAVKVFVNENELVIGLQLVDVNLKANIRKINWFYTDSAGLAQVYDNFERTKPGQTPWMTNDPENNARQLQVMNGNHVCFEIAKTRLATTIIGVTDYASHFCVVGVPPEFGKFSGYLLALLTRIPTADEEVRLIERLRSFSTQLGAVQ